MFLDVIYAHFHENAFLVSRVEFKAEVGIYKRKQELDQESDEEKKKVFSFFLARVLVFFLFLFS